MSAGPMSGGAMSDSSGDRGSKSAGRIIAVFGSSTVTQDSEEARLAFHVGRRLGERGAVVMNGGYGGVMEAVSRGARAAGGKVVGVTVDTFLDRKCNPHLSVEHATPAKSKFIRSASARQPGNDRLSVCGNPSRSGPFSTRGGACARRKARKRHDDD